MNRTQYGNFGAAHRAYQSIPGQEDQPHAHYDGIDINNQHEIVPTAALNITAAALDAISLAPTRPNLPLSARALDELRTLARYLQLAVSTSHVLLEPSLRAISAVGAAVPSFRSHLADFDVISLLLTAAGAPYNQPLLALGALQVLLRHPRACAHFADAAGPATLLRLLRQAMKPFPPALSNQSHIDPQLFTHSVNRHYHHLSQRDQHHQQEESSSVPFPLVSELCTALANAVVHVTQDASAVLRTPSALSLLRFVIDLAVEKKRLDTVCSALRLLERLIMSCPDDMKYAVRQYELINSAVTALRKCPQITMDGTLRFLHAAVVGDMDNAATFGVVQSATGLDLILKACESVTDITHDSLIMLADLLQVLAMVPQNFRRLHLLGLTPTLISLLPKLPLDSRPAAIALLARSLTAPGCGPPAHLVEAVDALIHSLSVGSAHSSIQTAGLAALTVVINTCAGPIPPSLPSRSVQAAHFAMTEHATDPRVLEVCAHLFLSVPPAELAASVCPLPELVNLLRARLHMHRGDTAASNALSDVLCALSVVVENIDPAGQMLVPGVSSEAWKSRSGTLRSTSSGSFYKSLGRRPRFVSRHSGDPTAEASSKRRTRSDFSLDYDFYPEQLDSHAQLRSSRLSWRRNRIQSNRVSGNKSKLYQRVPSIGDPAMDHGDGMRMAQAAATMMAEPLSSTLARLKGEYAEHSPSNVQSLPRCRRQVRHQSLMRDDKSSRIPWMEASLTAFPPSKDLNADLRGSEATRRSMRNSTSPRPKENADRRYFRTTNDSTQIRSSLRSMSLNGVVRAEGNGKNVGFSRTTGSKTPPERSPRVRPSLYVPEVRQEGSDSWDGYSSEESLSEFGSGNFNGAWAGNDGTTTLRYDLEDDELFDCGSASLLVRSSEPDDAENQQQGRGSVLEGSLLKVRQESLFLSTFSTQEPGLSEKVTNGQLGTDSASQSSPTTTLSSHDESDFPTSPSMDVDSSDVRMAVSSRKFGERERRRGSETYSGMWTRPNWSIWPLNPAADFTGESRSLPSFHPRAESGSLSVRR